MNHSSCRVLIVDDSALAIQMLCDALHDDSGIEIVGTARNGGDAIRLTQDLRPDLVVMDVNMPIMDGPEATRQIMAYCPTPILLVTASENLLHDRDRVFGAISLGALDVMPKPRNLWKNDEAAQNWRREFQSKVKRLAHIRVVTHLAGRRANSRHHESPQTEVHRATGGENATPVAKLTAVPSTNPGQMLMPTLRPAFSIVAIAASTGGPGVLRKILEPLPANFPTPIVIVQHIVPHFMRGLVDWLSLFCPLPVSLATDGVALQVPQVLVAPPGQHLRIHEGRVSLEVPGEADRFCPSADALFASCAGEFGNAALGVILSGMGEDGASGLAELKAHGGHVLAQDEASSAVWGMPRAAVERNLSDEIVAADAIAGRLCALCV